MYIHTHTHTCTNLRIYLLTITLYQRAGVQTKHIYYLRLRHRKQKHVQFKYANATKTLLLFLHASVFCVCVVLCAVFLSLKHFFTCLMIVFVTQFFFLAEPFLPICHCKQFFLSWVPVAFRGVNITFFLLIFVSIFCLYVETYLILQ